MDSDGAFAGGSQIMHLVTHKGKLYAATSYWKDAHSTNYGGSDPRIGWGQVLSKPSADAPWAVDFSLGPRHLRTELLKSVLFTQAVGRPALPVPEQVLLAATYDGSGKHGVDVFVRDDQTGHWAKSSVVRGDTGKTGGDDLSVRAALVYRDRVTNREKLFLSVGVLGLYTGSFEPSAPGKIVWDTAPESPPAPDGGTRILGIVEANDSLIYSEGKRILWRMDGAQARYEVLLDLSSKADPRTSRIHFAAIGGIRGLTAIDGPVAGKKSLIFVWHDGSQSRGCVHRLDPLPDGRWSDTEEVCLANLASQHIGAPVSFVLAAYSTFMPLQNPTTGEQLHMVGLEAYLPGASSLALTAHNQRHPAGGQYGGGLYALRDARGHWRVGEVGGHFHPGKAELVSVYTYALTPFGAADDDRIYLGGYDPNDFSSTNTAWIASAPITEVLKAR